MLMDVVFSKASEGRLFGSCGGRGLSARVDLTGAVFKAFQFIQAAFTRLEEVRLSYRQTQETEFNRVFACWLDASRNPEKSVWRKMEVIQSHILEKCTLITVR